jgi:hypothetical protein
MCLSVVHLGFNKKIKIVGCLEKNKTTIQSRTKSDIIDLQIMDKLTLATTIPCKFYTSIVKSLKISVL